MMAPLLLAFAVGLVRDALGTAWTRCVACGAAGWAGGLGGVLTALDLGIAAVVVLRRDWGVAAFYAAGSGLGCYMIMKMRKGR